MLRRAPIITPFSFPPLYSKLLCNYHLIHANAQNRKSRDKTPKPRRGPLFKSEFAALLESDGAFGCVPVAESSDEPVPESCEPEPEPVGVASDPDPLLAVVRVGTAFFVDETIVEGPTKNTYQHAIHNRLERVRGGRIYLLVSCRYHSPSGSLPRRTQVAAHHQSRPRDHHSHPSSHRCSSAPQ